MTNNVLKLRAINFQRKTLPNTLGFYFNCILPDGKEVCLESCLNGYDVAIYNKENGELIGDKTCTNLKAEEYEFWDAIDKAIEIANQKISQLKGEEERSKPNKSTKKC